MLVQARKRRPRKEKEKGGRKNKLCNSDKSPHPVEPPCVHFSPAIKARGLCFPSSSSLLFVHAYAPSLYAAVSNHIGLFQLPCHNRMHRCIPHLGALSRSTCTKLPYACKPTLTRTLASRTTACSLPGQGKRQQQHKSKQPITILTSRKTSISSFYRSFSTSSRQEANQQGSKLVDYLLADVGEGITECEIIKW
jgi:hypothetical protein